MSYTGWQPDLEKEIPEDFQEISKFFQEIILGSKILISRWLSIKFNIKGNYSQILHFYAQNAGKFDTYFLSWAKDMNAFHCFCESLYKCACTASKAPTLFIFLFHKIYFIVYKSLIMVVENFQKYHWIQHTNTQPVVITRKRNKLLQMSGASEFLFNWHIQFICLQI